MPEHYLRSKPLSLFTFRRTLYCDHARYRATTRQIEHVGAPKNYIVLSGNESSQRHRDTEMHENEIGTVIVDCAVHLHQSLGPGLLETVYEVTFARKLEKRGLSVQRQIPIAIEFEGQRFDEGFRTDLIVERKVR